MADAPEDAGLPVSQNDSVIIFRFAPGRLMFYSPFRGNETSIKEVAYLIEGHREELESGKAFISVRGYCNSFSDENTNRRAAKNRSNQVKSHFILHCGMKEEYYRTRNYVGNYKGINDIVAVIGIEYPDSQCESVGVPEAVRSFGILPRISSSLPSKALCNLVPAVSYSGGKILPATVRPARQSSPAEFQKTYTETKWYLKTNLLYDALLLPSLELEYRINPKWSVAVEGNIAWWKKSQKHKFYQLAAITPEARYWFGVKGPRKGHYAGLFFGGGWYDLENGGTGYKGEGIMTGLSYGYMFPVGRSLAFEAGVGLGYMNTWYEVYEPIDGHYVYQESRIMNYFGPLRLRFALVWNIGFNRTVKGGAR